MRTDKIEFYISSKKSKGKWTHTARTASSTAWHKRKAKRTALSQQMVIRLSETKPRGQLFPSRWSSGYRKQSQEDSSFPADGHQAIINMAKRTALSQQMATRLSYTRPRGQLFPSRWPPGYPKQGQEDSSFPADDHQAILNKAKRTALSQQMTPGNPKQGQEDSSFPADGHKAIINKAKRTALSHQMVTRLS